MNLVTKSYKYLYLKNKKIKITQVYWIIEILTKDKTSIYNWTDNWYFEF